MNKVIKWAIKWTAIMIATALSISGCCVILLELRKGVF